MLLFRTNLFVLLLFCITNLFSQINPATPAWVTNEDLSKVGSINTRDIKDGYYYLLVEEEYNSVIKQSYYRYATKIVSEPGLSATSQIEIAYDPSFQKAELHTLIIHRGQEKINRLSKSNIKILDQESRRSDGILDGYKTIYCNLSDLRIGDIVEYAYSISGHNKIFKNHFGVDLWLSYSVPVARIRQSLIASKNEKLSFKNFNHALQPIVIDKQNIEYVWLVNNPTIPKTNDNSPVWHNPYAVSEISNYNSWYEVKDLCLNLFNTGKYNTAGIMELRDSILASSPTNKIKQISAAVDFVQKKIRYSGNENGIYSHVPHQPDFVLKHRYGDCKDKAFLLTELLKLLDVKAFPVLVNTRLAGTVSKHTPSHYRFDHCIAGIEYNGNVHFVDATNTSQSGYFYERKTEDYGVGLVIHPDSNYLFSDFTKDTLSGTNVTEVFNVSENGDAELTATFEFKGTRADYIRETFATSSLNDLQENYRNVYKKYADEVEVLDSVATIDNEETNTFTTIERYRLKKFWKEGTGENKNTIQKEFIPYLINEKIVYVNDESRHEPLALNYPLKINYRIEIIKDGGWDISDDIKTTDNSFFSYTFMNRVTDKKLTLDYSYVSKRSFVDTVDYADYKEQIKFIDNNIVFTTSQKLTDKKVFSFNWLRLVAEFSGLFLSFFVCLSFYKKTFNYSYKSIHTSINGWLVLLAIGICITPLSLLISNLSDLKDNYTINYYTLYLDPSVSTFNPLRAGVLMFEVFCLIETDNEHSAPFYFST